MSRTHVHTPYKVKMRQPRWRDYFTEHHNHTAGPCDMAEFLVADVWIRPRCYMNPSWRGRQIFCGCDMCSGYIKGRRRLHQATRTRWRADARTILKTAAHDRDTPAPPRGRSSW
jgi:hypothetical protein